MKTGSAAKPPTPPSEILVLQHSRTMYLDDCPSVRTMEKHVRIRKAIEYKH